MRFILCAIIFLAVITVHVKNNKDLTSDKFKKNFVKYCYYISNIILGLKTNIHKDNLFYLKDKTILIANHQNYLDFIYLLHYLHEQGRHDVFFVAKKGISQVPILGKVSEKNCILLDRDIKKDAESIKIQAEEKLGNKFVLIIFPEGTFPINSDYQVFTNDYMKMMNKDNLSYTISPKYKGLELLLENIDYDQIVDTTMIYPENYPKNHEENIIGVNTGSLLLDIFPQECNIHLNEVNFNKENLKDELLNLWVKKDKFMSDYYSKHRMEYHNPFKKLVKNVAILLIIILLFNYRGYLLGIIKKINKVNER